MKVVLLAGGLGTRLREETEYRPKPMVEVGGRPILWHIMKNFAHFGLNEFVVCTGYKGEMIKDYFLNYEARMNDFTIHLGPESHVEYFADHGEDDWIVTLADTGAATMTGGRVKRVARHIDGPFIVTYGDGLADVDIGQLIAFHRSHGRLATVTTVRPLSRFGVMDLGVKVWSLVSARSRRPTATSTRDSSCSSRRCSSTSTTRACWSRSRSRRSPTKGSWSRIATTASGSRWTPTASP